MAKQIIKGDDLMLFDKEGKSFAYATSHVLTITGDTSDVTSKDHGVWKGNNVTKLSWEITSENLYTDSAYDEMFDKMLARESIEVYFAQKQENDPEKSVTDGDYENWTKSTTGGRKGRVYITSLTANANTGENATFSVTLTGSGKIIKVSNGSE